MNRLHVYTGEGKGKSTAAMGLALRSLGHGNRVLIAQFVKDGRSGELMALKRFDNAEVLLPEPLHGFISKLSSDQKEVLQNKQTEYALMLKKRIMETNPQTIILDELGVALSFGAVDCGAAYELIETALGSGETVVTGRFMPQRLLDKADYISRILPERHPYETEKLPARKGVEW